VNCGCKSKVCRIAKSKLWVERESVALPLRSLGFEVLLSRASADFVGSKFDLDRIGEHPMRGFNNPIELFAYHGSMPARSSSGVWKHNEHHHYR